MSDMKLPRDPKALLQAAIEELDLFAKAKDSRLEVDENGHLVASKENPLEKVVRLARCYLGLIFSEQARQEQIKKLNDLKQAILQARKIVQSHSSLLLTLKEGDDSQRKFADYALKAIERYNRVVVQEVSTKTYDVYHDERNRLLLDEEIKGLPIELPSVQPLSIKLDSHPQLAAAQKMFDQMSRNEAAKTNHITSSTHKKTIQFMIDTFHVKAIRMMRTHTQQNSIAAIVPLVKGSPLEIDQESHPDFISMQQRIEVAPGNIILVSGFFKRHSSDKFLAMPILENLRVTKL